MGKKQKLRCPECVFRARRGTSGTPTHTCEYILMTGKMRGCSAENCTRFVQSTPELERRIEAHSKARVKDLDYWPLADLAVAGMPDQDKPGRRVRPRKILTPEERAARKKEQNRRYREKHREQIRKQQQTWYRNHREHAAEYDRAYRKRKKEEKQEHEV